MTLSTFKLSKKLFWKPCILYLWCYAKSSRWLGGHRLQHADHAASSRCRGDRRLFHRLRRRGGRGRGWRRGSVFRQSSSALLLEMVNNSVSVSATNSVSHNNNLPKQTITINLLSSGRVHKILSEVRAPHLPCR